MIWKPNVTVAAVLEQQGRYLLVEEHTPEGLRFNQPAGHLEPGESLISATQREALEEAAVHFVPEFLIGIYRWKVPGSGTTYLRFAFTGLVRAQDAALALDEGIVRAVWMTPEEIQACSERHRSPLVWQCVLDHQAGKRYALDLLTDYPDQDVA